MLLKYTFEVVVMFRKKKMSKEEKQKLLDEYSDFLKPYTLRDRIIDIICFWK